jgi:superfamily II DNA or RNA helicase
MQPGDRVRLIANPSRIGILGNETDGPLHRLRVLVTFLDGDEQFHLKASLEKVDRESSGPFAMVSSGRYGRVADLRGAITYYRLSGKLANLIYSLNTTNTQFLAYQFKPVLHFLESPCNGILIADEVGLGKTIEAGLIWTELRARVEARRLLVVCPAILREKWQSELSERFGVEAEIVDAQELLDRLEVVREQPQKQFALIASIQGLRPPKNWSEEKEPSQAKTAQLARFLDEVEIDEPLIDMLIVDEAHYLRNEETAANRLARLLRPIVQSMVLLSATPIQLHSKDLFNLLHLLDADTFPYEFSFEYSLSANAPIVQLRDHVLAETVCPTDFIEALRKALSNRVFDDNAQLEYLIAHPPSAEELASPRGRSEIADTLDRINPLTKVVSRTLKRDVQEMRVQREPVTLRVEMHPIERMFYDQVTEAVQAFCEEIAISEGFMLTIPQRQMSSCIAAACSGWIDRAALDSMELESEVFELYGDDERDDNKRPNLGALLTTLVHISREIGDHKALEMVDSKYAMLIANLKQYWQAYPGKKIVLFSFYRNTLHYLARRLGADGIQSAVLHGGMDKQAVLRNFASPEGPDILISSEVASEGVDLQFSSLLINYDLPWNPARIEQRIGRIDRIGQEVDKILIWNFIYENTIDERIYDRLLDRLDIFRQALGSLEAILGEEIRKLSYELLSHKLTPEQEQGRIDHARVAIENLNRQQYKLEQEATQLIAHGDFIQNKVRAAKELGRFIRGEDLHGYVKDFLESKFKGTRLLSSDDDELNCKLELSAEARVSFADFLEERRLQGSTRLLSQSPPSLLFDNRHGHNSRGVERVTQDHSLVRFVVEELKRAGKGPLYSSVSAIELTYHAIAGFDRTTYAYIVVRWTVSGARDVERLEYLIQNINTGSRMDGERAEFLINTAAMHGRDWLSASTGLDPHHTASVLDECRAELEERFTAFCDAQIRENQDRVNFMVSTLQHHLESQRRKFQERIQRYTQFGTEKQKKMIPAERGRLNKLAQRIDAKIAELRLKESIQAYDSLVSCGVVRLV